MLVSKYRRMKVIYLSEIIILKTYQITTRKFNLHSSPNHPTRNQPRNHLVPKPNDSYNPIYLAANYSNVKLEELVTLYVEYTLYY